MPTSRTISGIICLGATAAPLVFAPIQLERSLTFVREMENRTPNAFPGFGSVGDLMDAQWWNSISLAFEDRAPFRKEMISLERTLGLSGSGMSSKTIAYGTGEWLFWYAALADNLGSIEYVGQAIAAMDDFFDRHTFSADLFILVAPDKATIYPEKLIDSSRAIFEPSIPQRDLLHNWFAQSDHPSRLDIWTKMLQRKGEVDGLLYEPGGSHFNSIGAMVMAKAMVDAVDPSLWDDGTELIEIWTRTHTPELAQRGGEWNRTETQTHYQIRREGVTIKELWDSDQPIKDPEFLSITEITYHNRKRIVSESATRQLIPGKTLVIHDSFIAVYLYPTLAQFFEDITFIHVGYLTPGEFREALDSYDRVYFQSAEHYFPERAIEYFGQTGATTP